MRQKTCKNPSCKSKFTPWSTTQTACSWQCAFEISKAQSTKDEAAKRKQDRAETRAKKQALKTRSQWMKEAQVEFNKYIRVRDFGLPCISCSVAMGAQKVGGTFDCGHYRSVGSAPHLRFDERNAHAQCKRCNRYGSGRVSDYRLGLMHRIGRDVLEALEADQEAKHYTIDDLKQIKAHYRAKCRELEQQMKEAA